MVTVILSLISQRRFDIHIGNKKLRCRILKNGFPQGSVLAPALFNLYTYDIPTTQSKKHVYADNIALLHSTSDFQEIESAVSNDLDCLRKYFRHWRLKLNTTETVCNVFHLANHFANYKLQVKTSGQTIQHDPAPKYLGVTLDRTLLFKQHPLNTAAKTTKCISLMKRLANNHWGADFTTLRTTALALCFWVAEYCSPVWCHSSHCHKLDSSLNECLRLICRCIKSTPTYLLPVLCDMEPADI